MLDAIFVITVLYVIIRAIIWGTKVAWGIAKVAAIVVLLPLLLVGLILLGLFYIALGLVIIMAVIITVGGVIWF